LNNASNNGFTAPVNGALTSDFTSSKSNADVPLGAPKVANDPSATHAHAVATRCGSRYHSKLPSLASRASGVDARRVVAHRRAPRAVIARIRRARSVVARSVRIVIVVIVVIVIVVIVIVVVVAPFAPTRAPDARARLSRAARPSSSTMRASSLGRARRRVRQRDDSAATAHLAANRSSRSSRRAPSDRSTDDATIDADGRARATDARARARASERTIERIHRWLTGLRVSTARRDDDGDADRDVRRRVRR
jgi:hypothetical protein